MEYVAIIVAGGSGKRMNSELPKQFLLLNGQPLLFFALKAFAASRYNPKIILVLPTLYHDLFKNLCIEQKFNTTVALIDGGMERFHSVKNAMELISNPSLVAVHDAARPLISTKLIDASYKHAEEFGNAVTAIKPSDSVRYQSAVVDRNEVLLIQTPQTFHSNTLKKAYQETYNPLFTDDASVVESIGEKIHFIPGAISNIKVTHSEDLLLAEKYVV